MEYISHEELEAMDWVGEDDEAKVLPAQELVVYTAQELLDQHGGLAGLVEHGKRMRAKRKKDTRLIDNVSVRELIKLLKACPDPDAFVCLRPGMTGNDIQMIDGIEVQRNCARVVLVLGHEGCD